MKQLLASLAIALLGLSATACGGANPTSQLSSRTARNGSAVAAIASGATLAQAYVRGDDDEDGDAHSYWDDRLVRDYGRAAGLADGRAIAALVKRYFVAAGASDGAAACSLMYSRLATSPNLAKAIPSDYLPGPRLPASHDTRCSQFMSLLFKQARQQLAVADIATLEVIHMRVEGSRGLALLGFRTAPERYIPVEREGGTWKIDGLLDSEIP